jgi:hypothetical protein
MHFPAFGGSKMKNPCFVFAAFVMIVSSSILGVAAQEPGAQGAGSENAAKSSDTSHSYNPINWIKKNPDTRTKKPKKVKNKKSSEKSEAPSTLQP